MQLDDLLTLVRETDSDDPLAALRATSHATAELERITAMQVRSARNQGASWTQIAAALGVSKQAVHKKYGGTRFFGSQQ